MQKKAFFGLSLRFGLTISVFSFVGLFGLSTTFAQVNTDFPFEGVGHENVADSEKTESNSILESDIVDEEVGYIQRLLSVFGLKDFASGSNPTTGETMGGTNYIKYLFNIGIGLSSLIALVFIIYGFAKMFFAGDEEGFTNASKIVKNAAIAIAVIGISWFAVSMLFYVFGRVDDVETKNIGTKKEAIGEL